MRYHLAAAALLAATVVADKRDLCSEGETDDDGNYYCQEVTAITYTGVGGSGSYDQVTDMPDSGDCSSTSWDYSGSLAPLDEEISIHFRGPLNLANFAFYSPDSSSSTKKKAKRNEHVARHAHAHAHAHGHAHAARSVGSIVTATIDGVVVSWTNEYSGLSTSAADSSSTASSAEATAAVDVNVDVAVAGSSASAYASSSATGSVSAATASSTAASGSWTLQGSYDASAQTKDGIVFLNHYGGSGSGTFDYVYGSSLSYASADGTTGASSSTILADQMIGDDIEVLIMTDSECDGEDGTCGYYRPNTTAYHGFDGASKLFIFNFSMPSDGGDTASEYDPVNMPAIWSLNAQIPRTLQYGAADCSCWESGCGEFDLFEVLAAGDTRMKSTLHGNIAGGDSDYFKRPEDDYVIGAMLMYDDTIYLQILDSFDFTSTTLDSDVLDDIISTGSTQTDTVSLFALAS